MTRIIYVVYTKEYLTSRQIIGANLKKYAFLCDYSEVKIDDLYVGIDNDNNLISYPEEMCISVPVYLVNKSYAQVKIGDVVKVNNSYSKVVKKNTNGSLSCLSYSGYMQNKKEIKDFMLGQSFIKVVINMFSNIQVNGVNPIYAPIVQRIEHRPPKSGIQVRVLLGARREL